jgi:hypothetical protein
MSQSRAHSLIEASLNTASGFCLSFLAGLFIFPLLGWAVSARQNLTAVALFTAISVVRSYVWRRIFAGAEMRWLRRQP